MWSSSAQRLRWVSRTVLNPALRVTSARTWRQVSQPVFGIADDLRAPAVDGQRVLGIAEAGGVGDVDRVPARARGEDGDVDPAVGVVDVGHGLTLRRGGGGAHGAVVQRAPLGLHGPVSEVAVATGTLPFPLFVE